MTLFEMTAVISACDAAMLLEIPDASPWERARALDRFRKTVQAIATNPPTRREDLPEVLPCSPR